MAHTCSSARPNVACRRECCMPVFTPPHMQYNIAQPPTAPRPQRGPAPPGGRLLLPVANGGTLRANARPPFGGATCTVRKIGYFGPVFPDGQDRSNYCVPIHSNAQILTQSKNSDKALFHTENAGLLSKSAVFALRTYASLVVGSLQGGHGKPYLLLGAVRALCRNAPFGLSCPFPCGYDTFQPPLCGRHWHWCLQPPERSLS